MASVRPHSKRRDHSGSPLKAFIAVTPFMPEENGAGRHCAEYTLPAMGQETRKSLLPTGFQAESPAPGSRPRVLSNYRISTMPFLLDELPIQSL